MRIQTEVISYNLNERGRSFSGVDRDIDIDAAMRLLNGPLVQECVRKGDIFGYVGHVFREKYGLDVPETVIEDGKTVVLEPAVKTVMIKCLPDGTVKHQQEFLNTSAGRIAARLHASKVYGFSSVFFAPDENGKRTPKNYFGMDLVKNPNYDTNRGYDAMLDSVRAGAIGTGGFACEYGALMDSVEVLMAANESHVEGINQAYLAQCKNNDELVELNARLLARLSAIKKGGDGGVMLDSTAPDVLHRGHVFMPSVATGMIDSAGRFMRADLVTLEATQEQKEDTGFLASCREGLNKIFGTV